MEGNEPARCMQGRAWHREYVIQAQVAHFLLLTLLSTYPKLVLLTFGVSQCIRSQLTAARLHSCSYEGFRLYLEAECLSGAEFGYVSAICLPMAGRWVNCVLGLLSMERGCVARDISYVS